MLKSRKSITQCKYGLFVHYVAPGIIYSDGRKPDDISELIDQFDAEGFVNQIVDMGVEYLILTAWHYLAIPLYPSPVTDKWRTIKSPRRDLLGEIIDGLNEHGVQTILYTHPRDGHDFAGADRINTGWGVGNNNGAVAQPNPQTFHCDIWNTYTRELYTELAEKYATRISGIYTDGEGPKIPWAYPDSDKSLQVVDYLMIRDVMKSKNPDIVIYQNFFGSLFSNDLANTEVYDAYVRNCMNYKNVEKWETASIATSIVPFVGSWGVREKSVYGAYAPFMTPEEMARYTMFNASCSKSGGVTWASGPFGEGSIWPVGVVETMKDTGEILWKFRDSIMDARCSKSYPTISGDSLESKNYRFWMTGEDGQYEYLHCMQMPENGVLVWGEAEDGITLADPVVINADMQVQAFIKNENQYTIQLSGVPDTLDTVIRFSRTGTAKEYAYEWINDSDKRIDYRGKWRYEFQGGYDDDARCYIDCHTGCYDRDIHYTSGKASVFFAFQGSVLEIYGIQDKNHGTANIYIDGVYCGAIDQNAEKRNARVCSFRSMDLHEGWHILQLYTNGDGDFYLDALRVIE